MSEVWIREASNEDALHALEMSVFADKQNAERALVGYMTLGDKTYVGLIDGKIVCLWGVMRQSLLSDRGYLWLIVTEAAEEHKFLLLRYSQRIIASLLLRYRILAGECLCDDLRAQRWMRLLGADFSYPQGKTIPFQIVGNNG